MEKFIPYEKLSKKEKRKIDQVQRRSWGDLNPVTRKPENSRAYNRKKAQNWKRDSGSVSFFFADIRCPAQTAPDSRGFCGCLLIETA